MSTDIMRWHHFTGLHSTFAGASFFFVFCMCVCVSDSCTIFNSIRRKVHPFPFRCIHSAGYFAFGFGYCLPALGLDGCRWLTGLALRLHQSQLYVLFNFRSCCFTPYHICSHTHEHCRVEYVRMGMGRVWDRSNKSKWQTILYWTFTHRLEFHSRWKNRENYWWDRLTSI